MCEFPSFLVQRDGNVIFEPREVSHTALAKKNKVNEDECIKGDLSGDIWCLSYSPETVINRERYMLFFTKEVERKVRSMPNSAFTAAEDFVKKTFYTRRGLRKVIEAGWGARKRKGFWSTKGRVINLMHLTTGYVPPKYVKGKKKGLWKKVSLSEMLQFLKKAKFNEPKFTIREE